MSKIKVLVFVAIVFYASNVIAYSCVGGVNGVHVDESGYISASSVAGMSWVYFCSVSETYNGVTPQTCKVIYASLLSAQLANKNVRLWFYDTGNCSTHPAWQQLTGWYWGPSIEN